MAGNNAVRHFVQCAPLYNIIKAVSKQWLPPQQEHEEGKKQNFIPKGGKLRRR
jgi:hypothetical protein